MSEEVSIQVNFGKPIPIFPLDSVSLLPQQVLPLHIFEPRYRQMVEAALDGSGQIAMATYAEEAAETPPLSQPPVRPAVCVGQIVQHEKLPDGRFNLLLQGVCRATILSESEPDEQRLFREAMLEPAMDPDAEEAAEAMDNLRRWIEHNLETGPLAHLAAAESLLPYLRNEDVPSNAVLELIAFALTTEGNIRYELLAESSAMARVAILRRDLDRLASTIARAELQAKVKWPKGCSWN
ncbi:MAG: LON peptidase substrate-binding domain-containing protein [Planctomycetota bacterium]